MPTLLSHSPRSAGPDPDLSVHWLTTHPREPIAITGDGTGRLLEWQLGPHPTVLSSLDSGHDALGSVVFSRDGAHLAVGTPGPGVAIYRVSDLTLIRAVPLTGEPSVARPVLWTPDDDALIVATRRSVEVIDVTTGHSDWRIQAEGDVRVSAVCADAERRVLAVAWDESADYWIATYRIRRRGRPVGRQVIEASLAHPRRMAMLQYTARSLALSPRATRLAVFESADHDMPGWRGQVAVHDLSTGNLAWVEVVDTSAAGDTRSLHMAGHAGGLPTAVAYTLDGHELLLGCTAGRVFRYDAETGKQVASHDLGHEGTVRTVVAAADGREWAGLASGGIVDLARR